MNDAIPQTQSLPPGTRLEEFIIERVLGSGGFGITYLARDTHLDRPVVIKENLPAQFCFRDTHSLTVAPRHTHGDDADNFAWSLENFSREAAILASLDHPGIVRVLRSFQAFGTAYFVMPFVEGETLDEVAKRRQARGEVFSEAELRGLLDRTLDALEHLHGKGIYHRDIKPGNILITREGVPVLIDFGSARQRISERSMTVVESAGYTPFEQLQSRGNVGPWSDLYALGATLVKVITGETAPKANDRAFDDPWLPLAGREVLRSTYSTGFLAGIDRAFRPRPEDRWQSAWEWRRALFSGEVSLPVARVPVAQPARPAAVLRQSEGEGKGLKLLAAVLVMAFLATVGWWVMQELGGGERASAAEVEKPELTGGLVLTSEPSAAKVLDVGGRELGVTPLELKDLPGGQMWEGQLEMPGYEPTQVEEMVPHGDSRLVQPVKLQPQPQKVIVTSEPSGAEVLAGGKVLGVTPLGLPEVRPGTMVSYQLKLDGYETAEMTGAVPLGKPLELAGVLDVLPQPVFEGTKAGEERELEIAPGVMMTFCWIPPGEFEMGSPPYELGRDEDEKQVRVRISKGFWLAKTEVTQAQWRAGGGVDVSGRPPVFCDGKVLLTWEDISGQGYRSANFKGDALPVERVDWNEVSDWCMRVTDVLRIDGQLVENWKLMLPTEAQWEYACRAGQTGPYSGGSLDEVAWYDQNSGKKTRAVGTKKANAWCLHDMHGNVLEWCADWYGQGLAGGVDPEGSASAVHRVNRGGSWYYNAADCRVAYRGWDSPDYRNYRLGFRPALVPSE